MRHEFKHAVEKQMLAAEVAGPALEIIDNTMRKLDQFYKFKNPSGVFDYIFGSAHRKIELNSDVEGISIRLKTPYHYDAINIFMNNKSSMQYQSHRGYYLNSPDDFMPTGLTKQGAEKIAKAITDGSYSFATPTQNRHVFGICEELMAKMLQNPTASPEQILTNTLTAKNEPSVTSP